MWTSLIVVHLHWPKANLESFFYWLVRVSLVVELGEGQIVFWEMVFGSFMISRPNLDCSHWLEFVYRGMLSRCHYVHSNEPTDERQRRNEICLGLPQLYTNSTFDLIRTCAKRLRLRVRLRFIMWTGFTILWRASLESDMLVLELVRRSWPERTPNNLLESTETTLDGFKHLPKTTGVSCLSLSLSDSSLFLLFAIYLIHFYLFIFLFSPCLYLCLASMNFWNFSDSDVRTTCE